LTQLRKIEKNNTTKIIDDMEVTLYWTFR